MLGVKTPLGRHLNSCPESIMPCYHPLTAYKTRFDEIVFYIPNDFKEKLTLPCGRCIGCRLERSRQWAVRCMHEISMFQNNCFITLTYDARHLPKLPNTDVSTLLLDDYQKFMKRLRKRFHGLEVVRGAEHSNYTEVSWPIRFFHCGEYGENFGRPHYHALLFNFDFPDKKYWKKSPSGSALYRSAELEKLWPHGYSSIGAANFESAAYVARYIMKKVNGKEAHPHYVAFTDLGTGEILSRSPEYITMSRRPGIGSSWFDKYHTDVFPHDYVIVNGKRCRPPKYYDGKLKAVAPDTFEEIKWERELRAQKDVDNNTPERLAVREAVQLAQLKRLPRKLK